MHGIVCCCVLQSNNVRSFEIAYEVKISSLASFKRIPTLKYFLTLSFYYELRNLLCWWT